MRRNKKSNRALAAAVAVALAALGAVATVAIVAGDSAAQNPPPEVSLDSAATFPVDI